MSNARNQSKIFPGRQALEIDLSVDDVTPTVNPRAFFVGGAGSVKVILADDTTAVTIESGGSQYHPLEVKTFVKTGTTATSIVAIY